jgi:hypothetical protein
VFWEGSLTSLIYPRGQDYKDTNQHQLRNRTRMWQHRLNYSGSSALMTAMQLALIQRTSNRTIHWSVGSPPDTTTVQHDWSRFTSHEGEFTSQNSSSTFNLTDKLNSLSKLIVERKDCATTHVTIMDTMLSPRPGVVQEGHCQPGMDPTPRTSQKEQALAMQDCPWNSWRLYLKQILARLSILILSKAYPSLGIL